MHTARNPLASAWRKVTTGPQGDWKSLVAVGFSLLTLIRVIISF